MKLLKPAALLGGVLLLGVASQAQVAFTVHSPDGISAAYNNAVSFLDRFTVNSGSYVIQSVGVYNIGSVPQTIEIRKNGGSLQTISGAVAASGSAFNYAPLTSPINVGPGDYIEVSFANAAGTQSYGYASGSVVSGFTVSSKYFNGTTTYAALAAGGGGVISYPFAVSTLSTTAVPEPAEWAAVAALGAGVAGFVIRRSRS
jgi:hypothetical protein